MDDWSSLLEVLIHRRLTLSLWVCGGTRHRGKRSVQPLVLRRQNESEEGCWDLGMST